ncbi:MAG: 8-oxo-dGTP diphosphatase [archaeon]|jgi:8-oxo-dGTP diphosphatase/2-hydroxy-dATP diphosphatase
MAKVMTLAFIREGDKILLGMKKRGFGAGRWNGFGGKVHPEETIEAAVAREFEEECGVKVTQTEQFGLINFEFRGKPEILEVHFFKVLKYTGEATESEEMKPQWFDITKIPFESMWKDDPYWMPLFLKGKKFKGHILFDEADNVLKVTLNEVEKI